MSRSDDPIIVVGGGVVGASAAYHLARDGHRVMLLERSGIAEGVSGSSFAWLGFAKSPAEVTSQGLRRDAATKFSHLEAELPASFGLRRGGALTWEATEAHTRAFVAGHRALGHPVELLAHDEILRREPGLRAAPPVAAFAPHDAGLDPVAFTRALLQGAIDHGATVHTNTAVESLLTESGVIVGVGTTAGPMRGSAVVLAAGLGIAALVEPLGLVPAPPSIDASPCCLLRFATPAPIVRGILSSPDFEIRQLTDTTLIAAEDVPEGFAGDAQTLAAPTLAAIRRLIVGGERVSLIDAVIADRPIPTADAPLLEFAPGISGLYLAAAHPAFILAGAIGAHIARDFAPLRRA